MSITLRERLDELTDPTSAPDRLDLEAFLREVGFRSHSYPDLQQDVWRKREWSMQFTLDTSRRIVPRGLVSRIVRDVSYHLKREGLI